MSAPWGQTLSSSQLHAPEPRTHGTWLGVEKFCWTHARTGVPSSDFCPAHKYIFVELWTTPHISLLSFFLFLPVQSSNLFKHHWIIPALGVIFFFLIKVNCHLFLTLIFNTRSSSCCKYDSYGKMEVEYRGSYVQECFHQQFRYKR